MRHLLTGLSTALLAFALLGAPAARAEEPLLTPARPPESTRAVEQGVRVEMAQAPLAPEAPAGLVEGQEARFRFTLTDAGTGQPLAGANPAAWMDRLPEGAAATAEACRERVEELLGGSLLSRPEVNLNSYYVLALNDDATVTVVDPLFGFGGTKLLALVSLASPGEDWVLSPDKRRLFISQPAAGRVAVLDTASFKVLQQLDVGERPSRLALQPDGAYLWVATAAGLAVVDADRLTLAGRVVTGRGPHQIAFSDDNRLAFVTNREDGTLSVVSVPARRKLRDVKTGALPVSVAWSSLAQAAYVSHAGDGAIVAVSAEGPKIAARLTAEPGLGALRLTSDGRYALVVNPERNKVHVLDVSRNRLVQTGEVLAGPDQITFSRELAYLRHSGSEVVLMVPLKELGQEGKPLPVVDFPGGQEPLGHVAWPSLADTIVRAPGASAMLVANPADRMIYYYKEGMAAPMGGFRNYDRQPRAVLALDRSLEERPGSGVYETTVRLERPGRYRMAFFLDSPRLVHCFPVEVAVDPELERQRRAALPARVEPLFDSGKVAAGEALALRFRLTHPETGAPLRGLADVNVLTYTTGNWHHRQWAREIGEGTYEVSFTPPAAGTFLVAVECLSQRLSFQRSPRRTLTAIAATAPVAAIAPMSPPAG